MFGHWYIVADQRTVRIFTEKPMAARPPRAAGRASLRSFELVKKINNPLGKAKTRDLLHQERGIGVKSLGHFGTSARYAETKRRNPHEEAAIQFAKNVVDFLQHERIEKNFTDLTVIAEPRFLGKLRSAMNEKLERQVTRWVRKDLQKATSAQLAAFLTKS